VYGNRVLFILKLEKKEELRSYRPMMSVFVISSRQTQVTGRLYVVAYRNRGAFKMEDA
jgi:hypothetical protein